MKRYINPILFSAIALATASCSQENPFDIENEQGEGFLNREAMAVEFKNSEHLVRSNDVNIGDFRVDIRKNNGTGTGEIVKTYLYSEMPEVVALPVGDYSVSAVYGENEIQGWECPYYTGAADFSIEAGKVTDNLEPVVCKLSNIRVTINFGSQLGAAAGDDAKVTVKVGQTGSLDFTKADIGRSGYFAYTPGSQTITATFSGTVDGQFISETKSYDNAATGNHYKINFEFHSASGEDPGGIAGDITVDATVTEIDMKEDLKPEDQYEVDDMRPVENLGGEDPGPVDPIDPELPAPTIEAEAPIDLNIVNIVDGSSRVVLNITSEADSGFTQFKVNIISTTLTPDELEQVGLSDELDLINPGEFESGLTSLQLPCNIGGEKSAVFDISGFMSLLGILGSGDHEFRLTVSDDNGTTVKSLLLKN